MSVYRILQANPKLSRSEIAYATRLSAPTVATIVQGFIDAGFVAEVGQAYSGGGRPARLVHLVPEARHILALDLASTHARAALIDLLGTVGETFDGPSVEPGLEPKLIGWLAELLAACSRQGNQVAKLAVAVPGVVAPRSGHVRLAPVPGWDDAPLAETLRGATGLGVVLENDVNALATAELHYGNGQAHQHVLYVAIGRGVGAGLLIDGQLYRGADSAAGEIGYSRLPDHAYPEEMNLGMPGPLERHLLDLIPAFLDENGTLDLNHDGAHEAFDHFAHDLAVILHNLVCLVNPELLVLAWPLDPKGKLIERLKALWRSPLMPKIMPSTLGLDAALRGVARLALDQLEHELCRARVPERS